MNIGRKHYDDPQYQAGLAKFDVIVPGIPRGWNPRQEADLIGALLRELRQLNPALKIAQSTVLNEACDSATNSHDADRRAALHAHGWWLRSAAGERAQWTTRYGAWEINISAWAKPDPHGRRYPEWLPDWENDYYFKRHLFDFWYVDNVMWRTRVRADWDGDETADAPDSPEIQAAFRSAQARHWAAIRALQPRLPIMGNPDGNLSQPEYRGPRPLPPCPPQPR